MKNKLEQTQTNYANSLPSANSHQGSDLTLRFHNLQTAHFTEQEVESSLRLTTAFILASPVHSTAPTNLHGL